MKKFLLLGIALLTLVMTSGCKSTSTVAYHSQKVECLGVELDGSQTLRSWGSGRNKQDAIEQAWKNAVNAVLFQGILDGGKGCDVRPLVNEPNAREKYEEYFNLFLSDGGDYMMYCSTIDEKFLSKQNYRNAVQSTYAVTVRVLRSDLRQRLRDDNVLPKK